MGWENASSLLGSSARWSLSCRVKVRGDIHRSSPVGTLASAQFCAAIPNFLTLEFHAAHLPFWNDLVEGVEKSLMQDGFIRLPETPSLGLKLNEDVACKFARKRGAIFLTRRDY